MKRRLPPYAYRSGLGYLTNEQARVLGAALERLEGRLGRPIVAEDVLAAGTDPSSPFHGHFEWDDTRAAHEYRLTQARALLRAIDVVVEDHSPVRAFIPVRYAGQGDKEGGYTATVRALVERPDVITLQLERCRADARMMRERYEAWLGFDGFEPAASFVRAAADLAAESISPKRKPHLGTI